MTVLTIGGWQLAIASAQVALWLVPVALAVLLLGLRWCARRRSRIPLQPLPPAHEDTQPMDEIDQAIALFGNPQRCDSVTEALELMERKWQEEGGCA